MKIILEHEEFICLQDSNRNPVMWNMRDIKRHKIFVGLFNSGLLEKVSTSVTLNWTITKLGQQILKEHSPWIEENREDFLNKHFHYRCYYI